MKKIKLTKKEQMIINNIDDILKILPSDFYYVIHYILINDRDFQYLMVIALSNFNNSNSSIK